MISRWGAGIMGRLLGVSLLSGCLPQAKPTPLEVIPLETAQYAPLLDPFKSTFLELKIKARRAVGYAYQGQEPRAFPYAIRQFYNQYPGFCPLAEQSFYVLEEQSLYMTVTAYGKEIRAFIYDQSDTPRFKYLFVEANSSVALPVTRCGQNSK